VPVRFLVNAMAPKSEEDDSPFQGIPTAIYCDSGLIATSSVFRRVMEHLGIAILTHLPAAKADAARRRALGNVLLGTILCLCARPGAAVGWR
jgi:hypothetical protein